MSDVILFDLDGTLTDSGPGIIKCVQYALNYMGKPDQDPEQLRCFVGPPLHQQFMDYAGFTCEEADVAVEQYRERYSTIGIYENELYDGIEELLIRLRACGKILAVASSKPQVFVEEILRHFGIRKYFEVVVGSELDGRRTAKEEVIEEALKQLKCGVHREQAVMVGDRKYDVEGAGRCGLLCIGAAYGYGGRAELEEAGAVYVADTVADLQILAQPEEQEETSEVPKHRKKRRRNNRTQLSKKVGTMVWDIFEPMMVHFLTMLFVSLLGVSIAGAVLGNTGHSYLNLINAHTWLSSLFSGATAIVVTFLLRKAYQREVMMHMRKEICWGWKEGVACALASIGLGLVWNKCISMSGIREIFMRYNEIAQNSYENQNWLLLVICVGILSSFGEELVFRGLIYQRAKTYFGTGWAIGISAALFGIYHGNAIQFLYAVVLGIFFAVLMEHTGSFWAPVTAHIATNIFSISYDYIIDFLISKTPAGEPFLLIVVILLAAAGLHFLFAKPETKKRLE